MWAMRYSIYNNKIHLETNLFVCSPLSLDFCTQLVLWRNFFECDARVRKFLESHFSFFIYMHMRLPDTLLRSQSMFIVCAQLFQCFFLCFVLFKPAKINWNINAWLLKRKNGNSYSRNSLAHSLFFYLALSFSLSGKKILTLFVCFSFQSSWFIASLTSCVCAYIYWIVWVFECANSAY